MAGVPQRTPHPRKPRAQPASDVKKGATFFTTAQTVQDRRTPPTTEKQASKKRTRKSGQDAPLSGISDVALRPVPPQPTGTSTHLDSMEASTAGSWPDTTPGLRSPTLPETLGGAVPTGTSTHLDSMEASTAGSWPDTTPGPTNKGTDERRAAATATRLGVKLPRQETERESDEDESENPNIIA